MPFWVLSAGCGLLLAALAVLLWMRRPPAPLWPILFVCQMFALLWVVGDLWATRATTLPEKQLALALLFSGSIPLTVAWWETIRRYVVWHGLGHPWLDGRTSRWIPIGLGGAAWLIAVTNTWHGQLMAPALGARNEYHWGAAALGSGASALVLATFAVCLWASLRHASAAVREKLAVLAVATLVPITTELFHLFVPGLPRESTAAIGLGLTSAAVLYGIRRRRLFNLPPAGLHAILRRDRDGMLFLDRAGQLLTWNPAAEKLLESLLLEPEMALFEVLAPRLEDSDGDRLRDAGELKAALEVEPDARPVFRYVVGGGEHWLRLSLTAIPARPAWRSERFGADLLRVEDVTRDEVTARNRRSETDRRSRAGRGENLALMAGGVGNDFNNLLAVIESRARSALEDTGRGLPIRRHLMRILKAAELARDLNAELVNYAGRAAATKEPVDLSALVEGMVDLLWDLAPPRVELRTDLARSLPKVAGDVPQLRQVLMNLVKNGNEAIGAEGLGVVAVRTTAVRLDAAGIDRAGLRKRLDPGLHVLLEVTDSGCGMSPTARRRAFDAFFSTKAAGRGLGLAVVSGIVETHRGAIDLETREGWGTTVRVWLPAAEAPAGAAARRR